MKKIASNIIASFSNPDFYHEIKKVSLGNSLIIFFLLAFVLGVARAHDFIKKDFVKLEASIDPVIQEISDNFPEGMILSFKSSQLVIEDNDKKIEELTIVYPSVVSSDLIKSSNLPKNFLYYTHHNLTDESILDDLTKKNLFVLTPSNLFYNSRPQGSSKLEMIQFSSYINQEELIINSSNLPEILENAKVLILIMLSWLKLLAYLFVPFFSILLYLISATLNAVLANFLVKIKESFSFKETWQVSIHLAVVAGTIDQLIVIIYGQNFGLYGIFFWILYVYLYMNLRFSKRKA